jgi:hypothetical protein
MPPHVIWRCFQLRRVLPAPLRLLVCPSGISARRSPAAADRGTSMTSNTVAGLYAKLNIAQFHSRPHVSNDNPFSEAHFKTLKYCPAFPGEFGSIQDANVFCQGILHLLQPTTGIPASRCTPRRPCTTAPGSTSRPAAPPPSRPPIRRTRNGSAAAAPHPSHCPPRCGSTSHPQPSRPAHHHKPHKQPDVSFSLTGSVGCSSVWYRPAPVSVAHVLFDYGGYRSADTQQLPGDRGPDGDRPNSGPSGGRVLHRPHVRQQTAQQAQLRCPAPHSPSGATW